MSEERWIIVPGFPGYRVSDMGRIQTRKLPANQTKRDLLGPVWRDMRGSRSKAGYCLIALRQDGRTSYRNVHDLVLTLFVGPRPAGMVCCHKDDVVEDNSLANLRWDTRRSNSLDAIRLGRLKPPGGMYRGEDHPASKFTDEQVCEMRRLKSEGIATKIIAQLFGASTGYINCLYRGDVRTGPAVGG